MHIEGCLHTSASGDVSQFQGSYGSLLDRQPATSSSVSESLKIPEYEESDQKLEPTIVYSVL